MSNGTYPNRHALVVVQKRSDLGAQELVADLKMELSEMNCWRLTFLSCSGTWRPARLT